MPGALAGQLLGGLLGSALGGQLCGALCGLVGCSKALGLLPHLRQFPCLLALFFFLQGLVALLRLFLFAGALSCEFGGLELGSFFGGGFFLFEAGSRFGFRADLLLFRLLFSGLLGVQLLSCFELGVFLFCLFLFCLFLDCLFFGGVSGG